MNRDLSLSALLLFLVSLFAWLPARAQQTPAATKPEPIEYKAGQVWGYKTAPGAEGSSLVILKIEFIGKKGNLIHIRVDDIPGPSCGKTHLTNTIEDLAVTEKMLRKSTTELLKENVELPDSYFEAYREWKKHRPKVVERPLQEVVLPSLAGGLICNWRQAT
jgi:hypothetical protein